MRSAFDHQELRVYQAAIEFVAWHDVLCTLGCLQAATVHDGKGRLSALVSMLIGYRKSSIDEVREERAAYTTSGHEGIHVWFDYERLDVYREALEFVSWCGRLLNGGDMPCSTRTALDRASTGVALNVAEGNGKFSKKDRCRFIGHARTAALQAAATLDVHAVRHTRSKQAVVEGKAHLVDVVRMLVAWERSLAAD